MPLQQRIEILQEIRANNATAIEHNEGIATDEDAVMDAVTRARRAAAEADASDIQEKASRAVAPDNAALTIPAPPMQTLSEATVPPPKEIPPLESEYDTIDGGDVRIVTPTTAKPTGVTMESMAFANLRTLATLQLTVGSVILAERVVGVIQTSQHFRGSSIAIPLIGTAMLCMVALFALASSGVTPGPITRTVGPWMSDAIMVCGVLTMAAAGYFITQKRADSMGGGDISIVDAHVAADQS
jgi:hypothetical protein